MSTFDQEQDFLYIATCIRHHVDSFIYRTATVMSATLFKNIYGMSPLQTTVTWNNIIGSSNVLDKFRKNHLLWTLRFLRHYQTKQCLAHDVNVAPGTLMKWVWYTIELLAKLKIVSLTNVQYQKTLLNYYSHSSTSDRLIFQKDSLTTSHIK